ncbi:hypothetical protein [Vitiosangium sp. GDMCC 1.1324]|uniref:hypothetical protein n=1 Tax=Vitiosangium sp. (strain GDMCC 1.1324) TaxID=2138576 RepID=UPI000D373C87|nr:hypothetical protein [Vitiosangium sp. GDMCC 1.1324]
MGFVKYVGVDGAELKAERDVVRKAIGRLFAGRSRYLSMGLDETGDVYMIISWCAPGGVYVSVRAPDEEDEYDLIDSSRSSEVVECVVGDRRRTLTLDALVTQPETVERAAERFFLTGQRLLEATWRRTEERYARISRGEPVRRL